MSDALRYEYPDPMASGAVNPLRVAALEVELVALRVERDQLREAIEGKWDRYSETGEPILPRGWQLVDGGRLDELEAVEADAEALRVDCDQLRTALQDFIAPAEDALRMLNPDKGCGYVEYARTWDALRAQVIDAQRALAAVSQETRADG